MMGKDATVVRSWWTPLHRLWSPKGLAEQMARDWPGHGTGKGAVLFWRARLLTSIAGGLGFLLGTLGLFEWITGAQRIGVELFATGVLAIAGCNAMSHAFRLWLLFKIGGWSRRKGRPVRRSEQPVKFWIWAAASSSILALLVCVVGYLLWSFAAASSA